MSAHARIICAVLAAAIVTSSIEPAVRAAEPTAGEIAAARELFEEGLKLEEKGDWAGALDRFRKVAAVKTTPQVRFHVALCLENTGKLVDALVEFQRAQSEASADASGQVVAQNSGKHVTDLKDRIPRLVVKVPADVEGATVTIDGVSVNASLVGTAMPLDPGKHAVVVKASKRKPYSTDVVLVERGKPVTVEAALPVVADDGIPAGDGTAPVEQPEPPKDQGGGGAGAVPWIIGGIGVAALIGGGVMYGLRQGTISDLEAACGPGRTQCPDDKRDLADSGKTYTTAGNVLVGVGVLGVATAVVLWVIAPSSNGSKATSKSDGSRAPSLTVGSGPGTLGLGLHGSF